MLDFAFFLTPYAAWPVGLIVLAALVWTAFVDARTGLVPPWPLLGAGALLLAVIAIQTPEMIGELLLPALAFYTAVWSLNMMWRLLYKHDALGMGDASWSFLACLAYNWRPVVFAWAIGAIIALLFLGARRLAGKSHGHVYFVPFLLAGLLIVRLAVMPWPF